MIEDKAIKKQVTEHVRVAFTALLEHEARHRTAYSASDVLMTFNEVHNVLVAISSDAMQRTQLQLFTTKESEL